jgi:hypothetical protein
MIGSVLSIFFRCGFSWHAFFRNLVSVLRSPGLYFVTFSLEYYPIHMEGVLCTGPRFIRQGWVHEVAQP